MLQIIEKEFILEATHKPNSYTGALTLMTIARIKGNYKSGPVPVEVEFVWNFLPDKKFWKGDGEHPGQRFPESLRKVFQSKEERDQSVKNLFKVGGVKFDNTEPRIIVSATSLGFKLKSWIRRLKR